MSCGCSKTGGCGCSTNKSNENVVSGPLGTTNIKKIIGVLSGKGGVGKTMVSSLLAVTLARQGYKVGILDADVTGPSIPKMFGLTNRDAYGDGKGLIPLISENLGIKLISINMMLEDDEAPVLWRGPIVGNMVKQFYTDVYWDELDFLIVDMPPGTSDVALSVVQEIPIDEMIMVTSPSKLVNMIVAKAINMARMTDVRIVGLVENMSYVKCECGKEIKLFNSDSSQDLSNRYGLEILSKIPLDPELSQHCDDGTIEMYSGNYLDKLVDKIK